jgi:hypothetical protein
MGVPCPPIPLAFKNQAINQSGNRHAYTAHGNKRGKKRNSKLKKSSTTYIPNSAEPKYLNANH